MTRLPVLAAGSAILAAAVFLFTRTTPTTTFPAEGRTVEKSWLVNPRPILTPVADRRPPDQTFLTYPEWFLVFGPGEQADFFASHTSTKFPFTTHIYQMWEGYRAVYDQIRGNFPFNTGYHVMIVVIATSSTIEFGIKAAYETVIGRLTDLPDGEAMTDEDRFNARFTHDYVKFLDTDAWYNFDFKSRLEDLWTQTPWIGPHLLRKWERRYILTTELAIKVVYGWVIGLGTHTAYEPEKPTTAVVVDRLPEGIQAAFPDMAIRQRYSDGSALVTLPRYAPFGPEACGLAARGVGFKEIAGNSSAILLTVLAPEGWKETTPDLRILFRQPLPTRPGIERVALATPVSSLGRTLGVLARDQVPIEHIYDF